MQLSDIEAYDWRLGRWSRMIGTAFVTWLDLPPEQRWLDRADVLVLKKDKSPKKRLVVY